MKTIERALGELRRALLLAKIFNNFVDLLLVFLASYLFFTIINITWYYSMIPTLIYAGFALRKKVQNIKYQEVEQRVPILKEKLRTAADNINKENIIVQQLQQEVLREMKYIKTSMFLQPFTNTLKMAALGMIAFAIVLTAALNVQIFDFNVVVNDLQAKLQGGNIYLKDLNITLQEGNENIYGEESILDYGSEELNLGMNTAEGNMDYSKEQAAQRLNFNGRYPTAQELKAVSDSAYVEKKLAKDDQELVKRYFNEITQ
ncbi:MAG: hypothetical protein Q7R96_00550 [Nanoarchaeota archaeon]|nr:hypothetical protein [Nanoarchaeota archaeon]